MFDHSWIRLSVYELITTMAKSLGVRSYLEIGTFEGGSLKALMQAGSPIDRVVSCDLFRGHFGGPKKLQGSELVKKICEGVSEVTILEGPSQELVPEYFQRNKRVDLSFVDGDHNYAEVWQDICNVVPHSRWTLVHDLDHSTVWAAFRRYVMGPGYQMPFWVTLEPQGTGVIYNATSSSS